VANFEVALARILIDEGGYSNNPNDAGGETKYGITKETARSYGYFGPMRALMPDFAKKIYKDGYWSLANLDEVKSQKVAEEVFDCGVNCGVTSAVRFLQRALNVLNKRGVLWQDVVRDGVMGPKTLEAVNIATNKHYNEQALLILLAVLRGEYYVRIAEKRDQNEEFMLGWVLHRLSVAPIGIGGEI